MGLTNINFNTITDYLALTIFYMKTIGSATTEMKEVVNQYDEIVKILRVKVPRSVFNIIVGTDVFNKINEIKKYI
jgi:hypothetical protein